MLGSSTRMLLLLLVCIGLLADNRYKVTALRNREFFIRQTQADKAGDQPSEIAKLMSIGSHSSHTLEDQVTLSKNRHILAMVNNNTFKAKETQEQKNKTDDSFQSSKRRVRRGSDPIHNKAQPIS